MVELVDIVELVEVVVVLEEKDIEVPAGEEIILLILVPSTSIKLLNNLCNNCKLDLSVSPG